MQRHVSRDYAQVRRAASRTIALGMKVLFRFNLNSSK